MLNNEYTALLNRLRKYVLGPDYNLSVHSVAHDFAEEGLKTTFEHFF